MKIKILTLATFGLLTTVIIYSCDPAKKSHEENTSTIDLEKNLCINYSSGTINTINADLVEKMKKGYRDNQLYHINKEMPHLNRGDAQSILFKLGPLKEFIYHLETLAQMQGVKSEDLGIRLYYAMYPSKDTWSTLYPDLSPFLGNTTT